MHFKSTFIILKILILIRIYCKEVMLRRSYPVYKWWCQKVGWTISLISHKPIHPFRNTKCFNAPQGWGKRSEERGCSFEREELWGRYEWTLHWAQDCGWWRADAMDRRGNWPHIRVIFFPRLSISCPLSMSVTGSSWRLPRADYKIAEWFLLSGLDLTPGSTYCRHWHLFSLWESSVSQKTKLCLPEGIYTQPDINQKMSVVNTARVFRCEER